MKGTADFELMFPADGDVVLSACADTDYAASEDHKSTKGAVFVKFAGTMDMVADILTTPLAGPEFRQQRDRLHV